MSKETQTPKDNARSMKWKKIRSTMVMILVMVTMLSTATYAWFSLTSSPTVTGMNLKASTSDGLKVSDEVDGDYVDAIALPTAVKTLQPVSVKSATAGTCSPKFYEPLYNGNTVTGLYDSNIGESEIGDYVAKYSFFLKSQNETKNVGIIAANASTLTGASSTITDGQADINGSFIVGKDENATTLNAECAVRIGIVVDGTMYIYEPNADGNFEGKTITSANNNVVAPVSKVKSNINGQITTGGMVDGDIYTSAGLFEVGTTAVPVDVYVWLEGTDPQCVDQIKLDEMVGQIQFTIVE